SPGTGVIKCYSYRELLHEVARFGGALRQQGFAQGERVSIYMSMGPEAVRGARVIISMPMVPEAVIAMLASARIGAIHSVVFGGFAADELATRINDARPKVIVSASCGIEVNRVVP